MNMNLGGTLCAASWACFALTALMIKSPSPLLLVLVPAQFALGLAAFFAAPPRRGWLAVTGALLAVNWSFLFYQAFFGCRP